MNILHINETVDSGGAAVSMCRLHDALRQAGHNSRILVGAARKRVEGAAVMRGKSPLSRLTYHGLNLCGLNYAGILGARRVLRHPLFKAADVVHLHNIHGGYFNYLWLPRLTGLKPVVWTLHDMWALTGHCAHGFDCDRWETGCGACPYPGTYPPIRRDATAREWRIKQHVYDRSRVHLVSPSRWLATCLSRSLLAGFPRHCITNGVDTTVYRPMDRSEACRLLRLPAGRTLVLFVGRSTDDPFKDFPLLVEAMSRLDDDLRARCGLVVLGESSPRAACPEGVPLISLGYQDDEQKRAAAYAASDVLAYPTRADNQPLVLLEAMACGCPMVSVNVGGVPELVRTDETGYLAEAGNADDFSRGLQRLLTREPHRRELAGNCRRIAVAEHTVQIQAERTAQVYADAVSLHRERER